MQLARARLVGIPPFSDTCFPFCEDDGRPRPVTVVHGGGGMGKTTLLSAIVGTRPGNAVPRPRISTEDPPPHAICEWALGDDDPGRPHPLRVISPNVKLRADDDEDVALQRREQALFDQRAKIGGFVCVAISATRWFSRQPLALNAPARTLARHDIRSMAVLDDTNRSDLGRETKQALAYAAISSSLADEEDETGADQRMLGDAMLHAVNELVRPAGLSYVGLDARSLEPTFVSPTGSVVPFDGLPTRARHLVAFAALPTRALWAAYPGSDPREAEGVVVIDEVDLRQDPGIQASLVAMLRAALPRVQWIVTTTSPTIAASCDAREVLALRKLPDEEGIELFVGDQALTH
jgi:hypothetical protein